MGWIEYTLVTPERQKDCFDQVLSSTLLAAESCSERCEKGGHPQHEKTCLQIAADLLVGVDRPLEALPLARKLSGKDKKEGKGISVKYHMAVIQYLLLGKDAPDEIEPGFLNLTYAAFDDKREKLLKEHLELFLRLDDMENADLNPNAPFND